MTDDNSPRCKECLNRERVYPTGAHSLAEFDALTKYVCPLDRHEWPNGKNCKMFVPIYMADGD